ncbi:MAG: SUF system NifU family Fe-S cluster assembly protein [Thermotogae bacterium]|nr:SUF system NifU family Fe-S cluster assembly protein [Thermotogota bacterium]MCP5465985.1 SUF system NifU family Fe-S cluster assembly protein [Thermotogota bacterium]HOO74207.1 SUF system NifU family Fe-S cluster assembly protein [Tepiditoga sp.]
MKLEDLYGDVIIDYAKNTKFKKHIEHNHEAHGKNTSCGDEIELEFNLNGDIIKDISYTGHGCIISQASTAMLCEALKGKNINSALNIINEVIKMSRGETFDKKTVDSLEMFEDISTLPMRVKCFSLSWHTAEEKLTEVKENDES